MTASNTSSAIKTPLNEILGSKGHVRVLRVMVTVKDSISHSELMQRTGLSRQGTYDVVEKLVKSGVLAYVGSGQRQQIILRGDYPLSMAIKQLFNKELSRYQKLVDELKHEISKLDFQLRTAWIYGKVAKGEDEYGDPLDIALLGPLKEIDQATNQLKENLFKHSVEARYDITIEVTGMTLADLEQSNIPDDDPIIHLWGVDPKKLVKRHSDTVSHGATHLTHQDHDERSKQEAKIWAYLLGIYPEIIPRTLSHLENKLVQEGTGDQTDLLEWRQILQSMSIQRLKKFLESDTERSQRLRQSLPFWEVLSADERDKFYKLKNEWLEQ